MDNFETFLAEVEKEGTPTNEWKAKVDRVRTIWEKYKGEDSVVSFAELEKLMENEPPAIKVMSGFTRLDELVGGFRYEQLVILSGQEKSGKTGFAFDMLQQMQDQNPCYFLFEQSAREIIRQRKEREQYIPFGYVPQNNVENKWDWIEKRMIESMVKYSSRVFVIDNVDWLQKEYGYNQRTDEVMRDLLLKIKEFCKMWGIIIILIAHVKKLPMQDIPQPDDIKDTSAFKQIADIVLILWRKTSEEKVDGTKTKAPFRTNETLLWVAENRQAGKTGYAQFIFDGKQMLEKAWAANLEAVEHFNSYEPD